MREKNKNEVIIEGRVFDHALREQVIKKDGENKGKTFISGSITVSLDEENVNTAKVMVPFTMPTFKTGRDNISYKVLKELIDKEPTVAKVGSDAAMLVRCTPSLGTNDFYPVNKDEKKVEDLVVEFVNTGGFINKISRLNPDQAQRNLFIADTVIHKAETHVDEEGNTTMKLKAYVFDYRNAISPFEFTVENPNAIGYFDSLGIDSKNPVFTKIWGKVSNQTFKKEETTESAFGAPIVKTVETHKKAWIVTGAVVEPYEYGNPAVLTEVDINKALQDREIELSTIKAQAEKYISSLGGGDSVSPGNFKF